LDPCRLHHCINYKAECIFPLWPTPNAQGIIQIDSQDRSSYIDTNHVPMDCDANFQIREYAKRCDIAHSTLDEAITAAPKQSYVQTIAPEMVVAVKGSVAVEGSVAIEGFVAVEISLAAGRAGLVEMREANMRLCCRMQSAHRRRH
jgi:hypothetical protein